MLNVPLAANEIHYLTLSSFCTFSLLSRVTCRDYGGTTLLGLSSLLLLFVNLKVKPAVNLPLTSLARRSEWQYGRYSQGSTPGAGGRRHFLFSSTRCLGNRQTVMCLTFY